MLGGDWRGWGGDQRCWGTRGRGEAEDLLGQTKNWLPLVPAKQE